MARLSRANSVELSLQPAAAACVFIEMKQRKERIALCLCVCVRLSVCVCCCLAFLCVAGAAAVVYRTNSKQQLRARKHLNSLTSRSVQVCTLCCARAPDSCRRNYFGAASPVRGGPQAATASCSNRVAVERLQTTCLEWRQSRLRRNWTVGNKCRLEAQLAERHRDTLTGPEQQLLPL